MYAKNEIDINELPYSNAIVPLRNNSLGSVPGLDDKELADELRRAAEEAEQERLRERKQAEDQRRRERDAAEQTD